MKAFDHFRCHRDLKTAYEEAIFVGTCKSQRMPLLLPTVHNLILTLLCKSSLHSFDQFSYADHPVTV